jgi:hypothetical protein
MHDASSMTPPVHSSRALVAVLGVVIVLLILPF